MTMAQTAQPAPQLDVKALRLDVQAETTTLRQEAFARMGGGLACTVLGATLLGLGGIGPAQATDATVSHERKALASSGMALMGSGCILTASMAFPLVRIKKLNKGK
jgi:hypothetical protein